MPGTKPKVSIGLPVYNGERFIADSIQSILSQTFEDFELVISDNCSTDKTAEICQKFAGQDKRIRFYPSFKNHGAAWNYNRVFSLSKGQYFRWHAADDMMAPTLIEKSVAVLDQHPELVLVFTWVCDIDDSDNELGIKRSGIGSSLPLPHQRFKGLSTIKPAFNCEEIFGLVRSKILAKTRLIAPYSDSDRTLLAELGLYGPFKEIEEALFLHRLHEDGSVVVNPERQERTAWFDTSKAGKLVFPNWRQFGELLWIIWRTPISWRERFLCLGHMVVWLKRRRNFLRRDLVWAVRWAFSGQRT